MATVAVYLRISTAGQNLAGQRARVKQWLQGQGIDPAGVQWYVDKQTGDNLDRPGFARLQTAVFNGKVRCVVLYRLDRLSRTMADGVGVLAQWLKQNVRVVSVCEQFDFTGAVGQMVAALLLGVAQLEQQARKERQQAGIEQARDRGVYTGRQLGSTKGSPARARTLRDRGLSVPEIAASLGVSVRTARRYLQPEATATA